ncbi:MAG: DUF4833 domain-containing protein [Bacteroidota bacterium]
MKNYLFLFFFGFSLHSISAQMNYPTPPDVAPRLFYIQRTGSPNTVVYDANIGADGLFQKDNPIHVYWLKYSENGRMQDLNYLQRNFAYGVKCSTSGSWNEYFFHIVSYAQRSFRLKKDAHGRPVVSLTMNGKEAYMKRVFVEIEPTLYGLRPVVHYVEIFGVDARTGAPTYEKFVP